jgi:hypothetical protein
MQQFNVALTAVRFGQFAKSTPSRSGLWLGEKIRELDGRQLGSTALHG